MTTVPGLLRIGTRASRLARLQTDRVRQALADRHPDRDFRTVVIDTAGDRDTRTPLPELGGKGVFTQELELGLRQQTIDLAVHSLKDLPVEPAAGITLAAVCMREDPREVLIAAGGWNLDTLPRGARVGTCSVRRAAQLLAARPDLKLAPLRGNVDTRVDRALAGDFEAIILAAAGVHRLGLQGAITAYLPLEVMLPAPGQGTLAIQCREQDAGIRGCLAILDEPAVRAATDAERGFLEGLGGGCAAPIAAFAEITDHRLRLRGLVISADGRRRIELAADGPVDSARELGLGLAREARARGADALLV